MSRAAAKAIIEEDEQITRDAGIFDVLRGGNDPRYQCPECGSLFRWTPALHQFTCPKGHATSPAAFASVRRTAARGEVDRIEDLEVGDPVMYRHDEIGARPLIDGTVVANDGHEVTISDNTNPSIRQQIDNDELDRDDWTVRRARRAVEALMREAASLDSGAPCTACSLADMNEQPHEGCTGCACAEVGHDSSALLKRNRQRSTEWLSDRFREQEGREGRVSRTASRSAVADLLRAEAYGETKAPAKVDTMRAENCPVCGDDEGFNGDKCNVCGYVQPPSQFRDPDLGKAQEVDLRQEQQEQAGMDPTAPEEAIPGQEDE
ncbi:MAG TPA: hypothetical protein VFT74_01050, partial [Isosphaeraceae bacterium]|nr:hypothetical protein [Isosphaeraceae bacterium]